MKKIEKAELKAYRKPMVRVIDIKSEAILDTSMGERDIDPDENRY